MRDNQARQRQLAKERRRAERRTACRQELPTALLVCEGECTEPHYLKGLLDFLGINAVNVEVVPGQSRSNAVAVVRRARERFEQAPRDRVFVLIDAEQGDLAQALSLCDQPLQRSNRKKGLTEVCIEPILGNPCFEVWLLLHFRYCDQPFNNYAEVLAVLRAHLPEYSKADSRIFTRVGGGEGVRHALLYAPQLRAATARIGARRPGTDMDRLIAALAGMFPEARCRLPA